MDKRNLINGIWSNSSTSGFIPSTVDHDISLLQQLQATSPSNELYSSLPFNRKRVSERLNLALFRDKTKTEDPTDDRTVANIIKNIKSFYPNKLQLKECFDLPSTLKEGLRSSKLEYALKFINIKTSQKGTEKYFVTLLCDRTLFLWDFQDANGRFCSFKFNTSVLSACQVEGSLSLIVSCIDQVHLVKLILTPVFSLSVSSSISSDKQIFTQVKSWSPRTCFLATVEAQLFFIALKDKTILSLKPVGISYFFQPLLSYFNARSKSSLTLSLESDKKHKILYLVSTKEVFAYNISADDSAYLSSSIKDIEQTLKNYVNKQVVHGVFLEHLQGIEIANLAVIDEPEVFAMLVLTSGLRVFLGQNLKILQIKGAPKEIGIDDWKLDSSFQTRSQSFTVLRGTYSSNISALLTKTTERQSLCVFTKDIYPKENSEIFHFFPSKSLRNFKEKLEFIDVDGAALDVVLESSDGRPYGLEATSFFPSLSKKRTCLLLTQHGVFLFCFSNELDILESLILTRTDLPAQIRPVLVEDFFMNLGLVEGSTICLNVMLNIDSIHLNSVSDIFFSYGFVNNTYPKTRDFVGEMSNLDLSNDKNIIFSGCALSLFLLIARLVKPIIDWNLKQVNAKLNTIENVEKSLGKLVRLHVCFEDAYAELLRQASQDVRILLLRKEFGIVKNLFKFATELQQCLFFLTHLSSLGKHVIDEEISLQFFFENRSLSLNLVSDLIKEKIVTRNTFSLFRSCGDYLDALSFSLIELKFEDADVAVILGRSLSHLSTQIRKKSAEDLEIYYSYMKEYFLKLREFLPKLELVKFVLKVSSEFQQDLVREDLYLFILKELTYVPDASTRVSPEQWPQFYAAAYQYFLGTNPSTILHLKPERSLLNWFLLDLFHSDRSKVKLFAEYLGRHSYFEDSFLLFRYLTLSERCAISERISFARSSLNMFQAYKFSPQKEVAKAIISEKLGNNLGIGLLSLEIIERDIKLLQVQYSILQSIGDEAPDDLEYKIMDSEKLYQTFVHEHKCIKEGIVLLFLLEIEDPDEIQLLYTELLLQEVGSLKSSLAYVFQNVFDTNHIPLSLILKTFEGNEDLRQHSLFLISMLEKYEHNLFLVFECYLDLLEENEEQKLDLLAKIIKVASYLPLDQAVSDVLVQFKSELVEAQDSSSTEYSELTSLISNIDKVIGKA
eukprot:snap_masked-scaffold_5-processed-gene-18.44-mRNA-1 protein AED:1.00 eAED:1.00 QI:0/-1/0/0/-1/1/1/0/1178